VNADAVVTALLERRLIRMVGRKEGPGRPILYGTTRVFLEHFGLRDLGELPPFEVPELPAPAVAPTGEPAAEISEEAPVDTQEEEGAAVRQS
jgi:segregation and condensation protein B